MTAALRPESTPMAAYLTQVGAAAYLGVSVRWFRDNVTVEAVPVGRPRPGKRPVMRYRATDLDAWVARCASYRQPSRSRS